MNELNIYILIHSSIQRPFLQGVAVLGFVLRAVEKVVNADGNEVPSINSVFARFPDKCDVG